MQVLYTAKLYVEMLLSVVETLPDFATPLFQCKSPSVFFLCKHQAQKPLFTLFSNVFFVLKANYLLVNM